MIKSICLRKYQYQLYFFTMRQNMFNMLRTVSVQVIDTHLTDSHLTDYQVNSKSFSEKNIPTCSGARGWPLAKAPKNVVAH